MRNTITHHCTLVVTGKGSTRTHSMMCCKLLLLLLACLFAVVSGEDGREYDNTKIIFVDDFDGPEVASDDTQAELDMEEDEDNSTNSSTTSLPEILTASIFIHIYCC